MGQITLDHHSLQRSCDHCKQLFTVSRGSVYEDDEGIAIYLAAMHSCHSGNLVDLAIGIRKGYKSAAETSIMTLKVRPTETDFQTTVTDASQSFWQTETYLGKMMDRQEALANQLIESYFHIADHVVMDIPEINRYLSELAP